MTTAQVIVLSGDAAPASALFGGRLDVIEASAANGELAGRECFLINCPDFVPVGAAIVWRIDAEAPWADFPDIGAAAEWIKANRYNPESKPGEGATPPLPETVAVALPSAPADLAGGGPDQAVTVDAGKALAVARAADNSQATSIGSGQFAGTVDLILTAQVDPASGVDTASMEPALSDASETSGNGPASDFDAEEYSDHPDAEETHAERALRSIRQATAMVSARADEPWPELSDAFGKSAPPEWDYSALPAAIQPYSDDQADRAGVDKAMTAGFCYTACAALLRHGIKLRMQAASEDGRTWHEHPVLWFAGVGDPSIGKGPSMSIALHKFYRIASVLRNKDEAAWAEYHHTEQRHAHAMQAFYRDKNPQAVRPEEPAKPDRERLYTEDATKEVVAKLLTENSRRKISVIRDELASWFGSFGAYGNTGAEKDRGDWLSFYESLSDKYVDRATDGKSYCVPAWGGCILGSIQPSKLAMVAAKLGDDGMLQRFQLVIASPKRFVEPSQADQAAVAQWNRIQENLAVMQPGEYPVSLTVEAEAFMATRQRWLYDAMTEAESEPLKYAIGKWEGLYGRLMITSQCIADAAAGRRTPSVMIGMDVARQAWRWIERVLYPHAVLFYSEHLSVDGSFRDSLQSICTWLACRDLRKFASEITRSDISRNNRAAWTPPGADSFVTARRRRLLDELISSGWLRPCSAVEKVGGLPQRYEVNPEIDVQYAEMRARLLPARQQAHRNIIERRGLKGEPGDD